jgi:ketosteroid isomerase-like protein
VADVSADSLRHAYEALATGAVEPLVALIHPEMEWRGEPSRSNPISCPPDNQARCSTGGARALGEVAKRRAIRANDVDVRLASLAVESDLAAVR